MKHLMTNTKKAGGESFKIIAIMQLPPPIHGQSIMNQTIYDSQLINESFNFKTLPLHFAELGNIGKPSTKKLWKMIYYLIVIFKELKKFKPDLVYFTLSPTGFAFFRDSLFVILIKSFRIKIVYHLHGTGIKEKSNNILIKYLYRFVFKNSNIILLSKLLKYDIKHLIDNNNTIYYLSNGIPCSPINVELFDLKLKNDYPVLLYISNITKTKGFYELFKIASLLKDKGIKFNLLIVGGIKDIDLNEINRMIDFLSLKEYVRFLGPRYGNEKYSILSQSDFFVYPTCKDAFPLVLLEAMSMGIPILSTVEGAIQDIVDEGKTGYLLMKKDEKKFVEKLEILFENKNLKNEMSINSKKKFETHYTKERFESNFIDIFQTIFTKMF